MPNYRLDLPVIPAPSIADRWNEANSLRFVLGTTSYLMFIDLPRITDLARSCTFGYPVRAHPVAIRPRFAIYAILVLKSDPPRRSLFRPPFPSLFSFPSCLSFRSDRNLGAQRHSRKPSGGPGWWHGGRGPAENHIRADRNAGPPSCH